MGRKQLEYALYKGDELLAIGTLREISKKRGVLPETIRFYQSRAYKSRGKGENRLLLIRVED